MDPVSQGMLGAVAAHAVLGRRLGARAALVGLGAGLAPDLDVLLPLVMELDVRPALHRHFTHALAFIPIGGLLCALPWMVFGSFRARWGAVGMAATVGWATHGPLDAATSYGTHLAWPFSDARTAWDVLPIIDPLFTIPPLILLAVALRRRRATWSAAALAWCLLYGGLGALQHERALEAQRRVAAGRGHRIERARAFPMPLSLLLWRSLYESEGVLHADWVRLPPTGEARWIEGGSTPRAGPPAPGTDRERSREAWRVFDRFADGWIALEAEGTTAVLRDIRFGLLPEPSGLWGMRLDPARPAGLSWVDEAPAMGPDAAGAAWEALMGRTPTTDPDATPR